MNNKAVTFAEKDAFRRQYMDYLQLFIANDMLNTNANKYYDRTNDMITQPLDTRNAEEKLADIENLRNFVRSSLKGVITNPIRLVQQLSDEDLQYVSQNIERVISLLKKKYAIGIPSDSFKPFLMELKNQDEVYMDIKSLATGRTTDLPATPKNSVKPRILFAPETPIVEDDEGMFYTARKKAPMILPSPEYDVDEFSRLSAAAQVTYLRKDLDLRVNNALYKNKTDYQRLYENYIKLYEKYALRTEQGLPMTPKDMKNFKSLSPIAKQFAMKQFGLEYTGNAEKDEEAYSSLFE
jgi:hypothetical protein